MPVIETKERPILFSGIMIRRILAGMKTQTRRVVNPQPQVANGNDASWRDAKSDLWRNARQYARDCCPYGHPGDLLWVRETFASVKKGFVAYDADADCGAWCDDGAGGRLYIHHGKVLESKNYAACFKNDQRWNTIGLGKYGGRWKPSIHMPRWASRITLEVTDVRVERVQEIPKSEAEAEGFPLSETIPCNMEITGLDGTVERSKGEIIDFDPVTGFRRVWDAINGPRGYGWDQNPYVWVVSFKRVA